MLSSNMFHKVTVERIITETADAKTFVLSPAPQPFEYRAGQFCTFRVSVDGQDLYRSYSMSSAPELDTDVMTTVKRVAGGRVSNWLIDRLQEGDELTVTRPSGRFVLDDAAVPLLGFAGGSGITPIFSLVKSALATTAREIRLLCADRAADTAIFGPVLSALVDRYPGRLTVCRHLDRDRGFLDASAVQHFVGADGMADRYICGPAPFVKLVRDALPGPGRIFVEDFDHADADDHDNGVVDSASAVEATVTITLNRKTVSVTRSGAETLLDSARRAGLAPPYSCEAGNCGTCIARLTGGTATMLVNDALDDDEVAEGYVLTCQAVPNCAEVSVNYE